MPIIERLDAVCGGWDRIGGSAWIELQNGRNLSKYSIESDVKILLRDIKFAKFCYISRGCPNAWVGMTLE